MERSTKGEIGFAIGAGPIRHQQTRAVAEMHKRVGSPLNHFYG
jgi:hypothetical protein